MSRPTEPREPHPSEDDEPELDANEDEAVRSLMKRAFGTAKVESEPPPDLLRGVQRKLRQRSKGKFYGDGWSTTASKVNYLMIALVMLVLLAIVYFALGPTGFTR